VVLMMDWQHFLQKLLLSIAASIFTTPRDDDSAQRKQHSDARVARECNTAWDLGYIPKLHCHHLSMRVDDHPLEHSSTT
jgi:hypothetical protein